MTIHDEMTFDAFSVLDFPPAQNGSPHLTGGIVYVLFCTDGTVETPFYVGQTDRFSGRMNDYHLANFKACTDFCVGEAVKYLQCKELSRHGEVQTERLPA